MTVEWQEPQLRFTHYECIRPGCHEMIKDDPSRPGPERLTARIYNP